MISLDRAVGFRQPLLISDSTPFDLDLDSIGEWAKACIYLGWWAKSQYRIEKRRITLMVLPCRETISAFIALGSMLWSIKNYRDGLTWNKFSTLHPGTDIYWQKIESGELFIGKVIGVELISNESAIKLEITKSRKKSDKGSHIFIPEAQFVKYQFSLEKPASSQREVEINAGISFLQGLIGNISPNWTKSEGQDLLLVTVIGKFKNSIENLTVGVSNSGDFTSAKLESLLGFEQLGNDRHSKLKITHPKGELNSNSGLVILDGPSAFSIKEHISPQNDLLIIFDLLEFNENELDFISALESVAESNYLLNQSFIGNEKFPDGFEISSYLFSR